ncbi:uncharacterized protein LOC123306611 isoform X2 [Coccinella septempunctata]|uniref:uncharacterized protein LOC123306611 isoform X2 n=1 Tax=Coccinella septempunctata TaxID=41139 RepID=UPI001D097EAC|nr:uncharacterized protein LOC123306611 isoform X2 [Coccinella septempunctata]
MTSFCRERKKHGGSAIYVKNNLVKHCRIREDINSLGDLNVMECCALEYCELASVKLIIVCIYHPNKIGSDINAFFDKFMHILDILSVEKNKKFVITGDFNIDLLTPEHKNTETFMQILESYGLIISINEPTRITQTSKTCLDNIFTNIENGTAKVIQPHLSDHTAQAFLFQPISKPATIRKQLKVRQYNEQNMASFLNELEHTDWSLLKNFGNSEIDEMWEYFFNTYKRIFENHFPVKQIEVGSQQRTLLSRIKNNPEIQNLKKHLDVLFLISRKNANFLTEYKKTKRIYDEMLVDLKRAYYGGKIAASSNKSRTTWSILHTLTASEIRRNLPAGLAPPRVNKVDKSFYMFDITKDEIIKTVQSMKNSSSCGYDNIPVNIVKISVHLIAEPLMYIMNHAYTEGIFPNDLKLAIVRPCYKRGPTTDMGLFLDLTKAFDCVDHQQLLKKLELYGIRDKQLKLIESYLRGRRQKVIIPHQECDYESEEMTVEMGVVQGSILGPLFFLVYINDLPDDLNAHEDLTDVELEVTIYADDTNIVTLDRDLQETFTQAGKILNCVEGWCAGNQLLLNVTKTECITFHTERLLLDLPRRINIGGNEVQLSSTVNFLGIHLDLNLKWHNHILNLSKKLYKITYTLNVLRYHVDRDTLRILYYSNFQSLIAYGIVIWGNSNHVNSIFKIQKLAIRIMYKMKFRESCRTVFKKNNLLTITGLYVYKCILFIKTHPEFFIEHLNMNNTRRRDPYLYPRVSLSLAQNNAKYMCLKLFNHLPENIRNIERQSDFRKKLYSFILSTEPYTMHEYFAACDSLRPC